MPLGAPWTDELAKEPAVRRLVRALALSQRFHFYVVTCKAPVVVDAVLAVVARETAEARGGPQETRRIDPYAQHDDFTRPMDPAKLIADVMEDLLRKKSAGDAAISVLDATLASPDDDRAWERLFGRMNERRNAIVKALPREFILFLPPRLDDTFKRTAPDFWSIRSGEYDVSASPPGLAPGAALPPATDSASDLPEDGLMEVAQRALKAGNASLRSRDGKVALQSFRRMQGVAAALLAKAPERWRRAELAERAALGVGRSLLAMGDVAGAEEAWRRAREEALRGLKEPVLLEERSPQPRQEYRRAEPPFSVARESPIRYASKQYRSAEPQQPYETLILYAPEDRSAGLELRRHLTLLEHHGLIHVHADDSSPGESWGHATNERLRSADLVLLLISPSFLSSERATLEVAEALKMAAERGTRVIPVVLRPAPLEDTGLYALQALPRDGTSVLERRNRDDAWSEIADEIERVVVSRSSNTR